MSKIIPKWGPWLLVLCTIAAYGQMDANTMLALKVQHKLKQLQTVTPDTPKGQPRHIMLSAKEINAYLAYRIKMEKNVYVESLVIEPQADNRIRGQAVFDLSDLNIPIFLSPQMMFEFYGQIETRNGLGRLEVESLFYEDQPVDPQVLDLVIRLVANSRGDVVESVGDWYELPYGIETVEVTEGSVKLVY